jgi:hypothetical protein
LKLDCTAVTYQSYKLINGSWLTLQVGIFTNKKMKTKQLPCCFNYICGLPAKQGTEKPIFDYDKLLYHLKNQMRLEKQRRQGAQADWKLRMNAPIHLLEKTIREIGCRCEPEDMRQGVFCNTCRLLVLVHKYMVNLFKEAAESKSK